MKLLNNNKGQTWNQIMLFTLMIIGLIVVGLIFKGQLFGADRGLTNIRYASSNDYDSDGSMSAED